MFEEAVLTTFAVWVCSPILKVMPWHTKAMWQALKWHALKDAKLARAWDVMMPSGRKRSRKT